jgi:hypothetical protein
LLRGSQSTILTAIRSHRMRQHHLESGTYRAQAPRVPPRAIDLSSARVPVVSYPPVFGAASDSPPHADHGAPAVHPKANQHAPEEDEAGL